MSAIQAQSELSWQGQRRHRGTKKRQIRSMSTKKRQIKQKYAFGLNSSPRNHTPSSTRAGNVDIGVLRRDIFVRGVLRRGRFDKNTHLASIRAQFLIGVVSLVFGKVWPVVLCQSTRGKKRDLFYTTTIVTTLFHEMLVFMIPCPLPPSPEWFDFSPSKGSKGKASGGSNNWKNGGLHM